MPRIERRATVVWEGNVARGRGRLSGDSGAFSELPYSLATRIGQPEGQTSPEELLAAAHGGCLVMSVASELTSASTPPDRLEAIATVRMDEVEGQGHQVVLSTVTIRGRVPGADGTAWAKAVAAGDAGCPFSTLLRKAGVEVVVNAELEEE
jgi:osmotically inducible protein OsmC